MVCVQEAKRQPLLNSFDLKGVAERIKSGKCMRSELVSNATVCLTNNKINCSAMVPVFQLCLITSHQLYLWAVLHPPCKLLATMLLLPVATQRF